MSVRDDEIASKVAIGKQKKEVGDQAFKAGETTNGTDLQSVSILSTRILNVRSCCFPALRSYHEVSLAGLTDDLATNHPFYAGFDVPGRRGEVSS